jgi:glycogen debranching enzyme
MPEFLQIQEQYSILATTPRVDEHTRVLKHGESFAVFDQSGSIRAAGLGELGLFHEGTRFLSRLELFIEGQAPLLLSSTVRQDNALVADLTNPDVVAGGETVVLPRDTVHVFLNSFLWEGACYVRFRIHNYGLDTVTLRLAVLFDADYRDIFEIRGMDRERRGERLDPTIGNDSVQLGYRGLDGKVRRTRLLFSPRPVDVSATHALFQAEIEPRDEAVLQVKIGFEADGNGPAILTFDEALSLAESELRQHRERSARVETSSLRLNDWLERSAADLAMMLTETPDGDYPYAGIPWFSTVFGRDGLITALETLWLDPDLARGVLRVLARTQATRLDPEQDAEPGKIIHEMRRGEMANLGEVPFGRYYGTVDATPLFVVLAGRYHERTGDLAFIDSIWPSLEAALRWMDEYGDADGDGFLEYMRHSAKGLVTQGWKDSSDSIFHADGRLAEGAVALCEVQGYAWAARRHAARLAELLGKETQAQLLRRQADAQRDAFERAFWCDELSTYALALDGEHRPCRVRTSNAGHCLFTGIVAPERGARVAETLLEPTSFSGWGVRTVDAREPRYNPMAYHNGSIWPHDNALVAAGLARYGRKDLAGKILTGLLEVSTFVDLHRMPELFCGFHQRSHEGPTLYPVACAPQAWAAGSVFMILQACLGLTIDAQARRVTFHRPELPDWLRTVTIRDLAVGSARLDFTLVRHAHDVGLNLERRTGEVEVVVVK